MASRVLAGRYELMEKIGEGGMAVVFKSLDRLLNRMVAIKILRPEYTKDDVYIDNFRRESQLAAGMVHPNIVNIFDVGKQGNIYYIVMELIDGRPLSRIIKDEGSLDPRRATKIAREIAAALSTAHKHHLIHRDVKPHNIMITSEGVAKITDFGIAKQVSSDTFVGKQKEAVMGSVHYFSPEQARGGYVDERSDIYSLGIVLYEMLTGQVPYDGETAVEVAVKHMNDTMIPPSQINPDIPEDLSNIVMKATDKLQVNRYRDADEMILALNLVKFSRMAAAEAEQPAEEEHESPFDKIFDRDDDDEDSRRGILGFFRKPVDETEEDEEEDTEYEADEKPHYTPLHPRPWVKKVYIICLAVLLAIPISALASKIVNNIKNGKNAIPEEIALPNLAGMDFDEAAASLAKYGITLERQMTLVSDTYSENQIMSQSPSADTVVKTGNTTVKVTVSKGQAANMTPNVVGVKYSDARFTIEKYGYKVGSVTHQYSDSIEANFIISQSPDANTSLAKGQSINLVVSDGKKSSLNLIGMAEDKAKETITKNGFALGGTSYEYSDDYAVGVVCSQDPSDLTDLKPGSFVSITVSKGKDPNAQQPVNPDDPDDGENGEGGNSGTGEHEYVASTVTIKLDLTIAQVEEFELRTTLYDLDGTHTTVKEVVRKSDQVKYLSVTGRGVDAFVYIQYGEGAMFRYSINFDTGQVKREE